MTRTAMLFLSLLLLSNLAVAQTETLPDSPSAAQSETVARVDADAAPAAVIATPAKPRRTADGKYWSMMALTTAAMVADVETTVRSLNNPRCSEANPFLGENPSRSTLYAIKGGVGAATGIVSYFAKKRGWNKWWLFPVVAIGGNGFVAIHNYRTGCM